MSQVRIEHLETSGTFSIDGETYDVDNNVWLIGDDQQVVVIDPAHDAEAIRTQIGGRQVAAILLTHGHDDHISEVLKLRDLVDAPVLINSKDRMLWDAVHQDSPDGFIHHGDTFKIAGVELKALETPGHSPGSTCFYAADLQAPGADSKGVLFSGDTLFNGGPGATGGRSYSSFEDIIASIQDVLFAELPEDTVVLTGHGDSTTIGAEKPHLQEWIERGY